MIFVTVGSQKFPFDRLIRKVDQMLREGLIQEEVFIQTGASRCVPSCPHQAFCEGEQFQTLLETCSVLITHGGAGTMVDAVKRGKRVIVVPRLARYGEHVDDHQRELVRRMHQLGLVYACLEVEELGEALRWVRSHPPKPFRSNTEAFLASLDQFLGAL